MKNLFTFLTAALCLCLANRANAQTVGSGATGGCTWTLTGTTGDYALTVGGNGAMENYTDGNAPWYAYKDGIETLTIQEGVTAIGSYAFSNCTALAGITAHWASAAKIPDISGQNVFAGVTPGNVTMYIAGGTSASDYLSKGWPAFNYTTCTFGTFDAAGTLTWALCNGTLTITGEGPMPDYDQKDNRAPWYSVHNTITTIVIQPGVTYIGRNAFRYCEELTSITIPESVGVIGAYAFAQCISLESILLTDNVKEIEMDAFVNCEKLASITIPKDLTVIQAYTFNGCSGLESIVVPDKVTEIATGAFSNCTRLESITIPEGVTKIQSSVFSNCRSLTSVTLPESLASLESYAFQNCLKLESVNIPEKITIIDFGLFLDCTSLKTVALPKGTTIIGNGLSGNGTFERCTSLQSIDIPASVTSINGTTFRYCNALADVSVNWTEAAKIPTPGSNVFSGLTTADIRLHIPAGTKELYEAADVWKTFDIVTNTFVAVTDITDVPAAVMAGDYLPYLRIISSYPPEILLGTVVPADATNKLIEWSVKDAGTTNIGYSDIVTYEYQNGKIVQIREASFHMNNTGTCILTATVTDGLAVGTDYTKDFSITVTSSPTNITVHPQAADYTVGETATALSVTATALNGGTLSYQWYANTTDNNTGGTLITDATGSSYTPPTGTAGTTYYYVEITNSKTGSPDNMIASQTAAITVTSVVSPVNAQTPIISGQPQSVTVVIDAPTTLSVTASVSDNGTLSYQWYSNTADSNTGGTAITGATGSSYSPPTATTGTNWFYVVVTNTNSNVSGIQTATATSNAASVTVEEASTGDEEEDDEDEDDPDSDPDPDPDPEIPTGTEELPQAEALSAYTQNGRLYVTGLIPGQPWRLYSITGSLIANKTAATSEAELSLPARGVYIIQSGKKTIKTVY